MESNPADLPVLTPTGPRPEPAKYARDYHNAAPRPGPIARLMPSLHFYLGLLGIVSRASAEASTDRYHDAQWSRSSADTGKLLENTGVPLHIEGTEHLAAQQGQPAVIIGNHMSTLETFLLPSICVSHFPVTFVVKESLVRYPLFGPVMRSRQPVVVGRANPREDLKTVMTEGQRRLQAGISIIVFPQTTRTPIFDPRQFNSIGVKLATRAGVPVIPLALKTDAWGNGQRLKDFGPIRRHPVHIRFAPPISPETNPKTIQTTIIEHIEGCLKEWG